MNNPPDDNWTTRLQAAKSRSGLASLLQIKHSQLTYLLYGLKEEKKYREFEIPKRNGESRTISAPIEELKSLQRHLSDVLNNVLSELESRRLGKNNASHGFRLGRSILTNAVEHKNKRFVFNIDLKDFFPSITGKRIRGYFIKNKKLGIHDEVATTLAHISCYKNSLPQGAPTSPVISNFIAEILDSRLAKLAKITGCHYTRYADDITFSTNKKIFPPEIAVRQDDGHAWTVGSSLQKAILSAGFVINDGKTRMQYRSSRQQVTGLVVNEKVNVANEYRRLVRAYVFALINHGEYKIKTREKDAEGKMVDTHVKGSIARLHGMLSFIHSVDNIYLSDVKNNPQNYKNISIEQKSANSKLQVFRRFLFYTRFYSNTAPLVICEGKTDNLYISAAVHQNRHLFPELLKKSQEGKDVLSFFLMKYDRKHKKKPNFHVPNFSTVSILGAGSGGVDNLVNLLTGYKSELKRFKTRIGDFPVIFVTDNDLAARKLFGAAVKLSEPKVSAITGGEQFINVYKNVYVVPIPKDPTKAETVIEDLFKKKDIPEYINGKKLSFSNDNTSELAGKSEFAFDYVEKNSENIDWTGFHPLLASISACIRHWSDVGRLGHPQ